VENPAPYINSLQGVWKTKKLPANLQIYAISAHNSGSLNQPRRPMPMPLDNPHHEFREIAPWPRTRFLDGPAEPALYGRLPPRPDDVRRSYAGCSAAGQAADSEFAERGAERSDRGAVCAGCRSAAGEARPDAGVKKAQPRISRRLSARTEAAARSRSYRANLRANVG
jgi:hypothetical protein